MSEYQDFQSNQPRPTPRPSGPAGPFGGSNQRGTSPQRYLGYDQPQSPNALNPYSAGGLQQRGNQPSQLHPFIQALNAWLGNSQIPEFNSPSRPIQTPIPTPNPGDLQIAPLDWSVMPRPQPTIDRSQMEQYPSNPSFPQVNEMGSGLFSSPANTRRAAMGPMSAEQNIGWNSNEMNPYISNA